MSPLPGNSLDTEATETLLLNRNLRLTAIIKPALRLRQWAVVNF